MTTDFLALPSTDGYLLSIGELGTELRIERLRRDHGELIGELTVASNLPGTRSKNGTLHVADFNLSSARARIERAKILAERANTNDLDWIGILEDLCQSVVAAERAGRPASALRDMPAPLPDDSITIDGTRILRRLPICLFGDGADGKSYLALYWAVRLAELGWRVLYADWEFSGEDHRERLERITGPDMPDGILYVRCDRPMTDEADRLRRIVAEERIDYLIADSVAFACDGPPEAAEVAARYFRALRRIGVGSLNVAHVRQENGDQKPFGSAFWHNGFRSTIFAKRSAESTDRVLDVGLFNRKQSTGSKSRPTGYRIDFADGRTTFASIEVADIVDLANRMPVRQRMFQLLGSAGALTMAEIADRLDIEMNTIVQTVRRGEGKVFVRTPGPDGIYRIGLLATGVH